MPFDQTPHAVLSDGATPVINYRTGAVVLPLSLPATHVYGQDEEMPLFMTASEADRLMWALGGILRNARLARRHHR